MPGTRTGKTRQIFICAVKSFFIIRWSGSAEMFGSVLDYWLAIANTFINEMTRMPDQGSLLGLTDRNC